MPESIKMSRHGMKLTHRTRDLKAFYSTEIDETWGNCLYRRCDAFVEGTTSVGCRMVMAEAYLCAVESMIIALHNFKNRRKNDYDQKSLHILGFFRFKFK